MIILDANILKGISLRGPVADLLRTIRASGAERVVAPWIAMEELAAQQALAYEVKHAAAVGAMEALRRATPWSRRIPGPRELDLDRVREHWREQYAQIADILQTSAHAYEQALFREANLIAPCKTVNSGKHKTGARDAAIWLTAVEYAKAHPSNKVYFISNNTDDFGDGSEFPPALAEDLDGLEDRFALYTSVDGVVDKLATKVEVSEEEVTSLLKAQEGRSSLSKQARSSVPFTATIILNGANEPSQHAVSLWTRTPAATLSTVSEISGYEIDGHKWFTATARWLLSGRARAVSRRLDGARTYAAWTTRVLLSTTAPEKGVTVLRAQPPVPLAAEETASIPKNEPFLVEDAARLVHDDLRIGHLLAATEIDPDVFREIARHLPSQAIDQKVLGWVAESFPTPDVDLSRIEELLRSQLSFGESETLRQAGIELLSRLRERELDQPDDE
ncbi:PIN domain-containing protein [Streptomyces sp. NPDC005248]|uniref:PIN domain-containing protein n=1 Tax=Streptomyces sp. NPDC005248 TaxID=3364709 RepID=UPI003693253A